MTGRYVAALLLVLLTTGCSSTGPGSADEPPSPDAPTGEASSEPARMTEELDSIGVIGASGATGTVSDPTSPGRDAHENSWATGDNPEVRSIYLRLLATHPAMEGHAYNVAVNGSTVDALADQVDSLVEESEVVPDLVLVQTMDNDMRCDGTDDENYRPFGRTLDRVLARIDRKMPGSHVFFVSQWATVEAWADWAQHIRTHVAAASGTGPCDVFDRRGRPRPAGIASLEAIVGRYWQQIERACAGHPRCATDGGALHHEFVPTDRDLSIDNNHLSVQGHAKFAAIAWQALPDSIKQAR